MADLNQKKCDQCGSTFPRKGRLSETQWAGRRYCSKKCAATKYRVDASVLAKVYGGGQSAQEVGAVFGLSGERVRSILRTAGYVLRPLSEAILISHSKPDFRDACADRARGRKHSEIAKAKLRALCGENSPTWRGGVTRDAHGYPVYTRSKANGENAGKHVHRVVAELTIGRPILPGEHVHHIDFDKTNNAPSNLRVMSARDHHQLHAKAANFGRNRSC